MGRVLAISSQVVRGHVGLSAIVPALQRLGHEVLAIPTIILSNHPGHPRAAGTRLEVNTLSSMVEVLDANGWLTGIDAVLTGYMPSVEHVTLTARAIDLVRKRSAVPIVLVDPVLGDDPRGLYIERTTADAIRDALVPRATLITPNRFELSWLSGCEVTSIESVRAAAAALPTGVAVLATSIPAAPTKLANVLCSAGAIVDHAVERQPKVPHGTGDLLTGLYIAHILKDASRSADMALGKAVSGVESAIRGSLGRTDLDLSGSGWST